jgi:hypothetical protein
MRASSEHHLAQIPRYERGYLGLPKSTLGSRTSQVPSEVPAGGMTGISAPTAYRLSVLDTAPFCPYLSGMACDGRQREQRPHNP